VKLEQQEVKEIF